MTTDIIQVSVEGIAFGGKGIARHEGLVIFIPYTAPGDIIKCRITQRKKTFANAELVEILASSPTRIQPRCPYFGSCGGCQLQHIDYPSQLDYKQQCVADALQRIGHLNTEVQPTIASSQHWDYRRHVTLTMRSINNRLALGYIANDNVSLLEVKQCPIFIPSDDDIIKTVSAFVNKIPTEIAASGKVTIFKSENDHYLLYFQIPHAIEDDITFKQFLENNKNISGIVVKVVNKSFSLGETQLHCQLEGLTFSFVPGAFIQNHPEQSLNIYKTLIESTKESKPSNVLDLYCGIGISSLLLAKEGFTVCGVEENRLAIELANKNALANQISNVQFIQGDVQKVLRGLLKKHHPQLVIVNPPRIGLDPRVIKTLLLDPPNEIIYISCMPATLARDLNLLCGNLYQIKRCQPFDMFPQTAHVETVVHISRYKG